MAMNANLKARVLAALERLEVLASDGSCGSELALEVAQLLEEVKAEEEKPVDERIRWQRGRFRVVAPTARRRGGSFYVNEHLVLEKTSTDALGQKVWVRVASLNYGRESTEFDRLVFALLAGDCDDLAIREFLK